MSDTTVGDDVIMGTGFKAACIHSCVASLRFACCLPERIFQPFVLLHCMCPHGTQTCYSQFTADNVTLQVEHDPKCNSSIHHRAYLLLPKP